MSPSSNGRPYAAADDMIDIVEGRDRHAAASAIIFKMLRLMAMNSACRR